jgi:hypothetical protein
MLKNAGIVTTDLELASAYPPPMAASRVSSGFRRAVSGGRTTTPAAVDLRVDDSHAVAESPKKRGKLLIFAVLGVAAAAGAFVALRGHGAETPPTVAVPAPGAAQGAPDNASQRPAASVLDLDQEAANIANRAAPAKSGGLASSSASAHGPSKAKAARPAAHAPAAPAAPGKRPRANEDELDPGF